MNIGGGGAGGMVSLLNFEKKICPFLNSLKRFYYILLRHPEVFSCPT